MKRNARRLAIHSRRVLTGTGEVQSESTVECPPRGRAVDVDVCFGCVHGGRDVRRENGRSFVRCSQATLRGPRPLGGLDPTPLSGLGLLTPIADVMTPSVLCVRSDVDVDSIVALLDEHRINAVPVVDEVGRPIGIVSKTDLLREIRHRPPNGDETVRVRGDDVVYDLDDGFHVDSLGRMTAEDVMTKVVVWLPADAPLATAAGIMAAERIHSAVALSDDRRVIGIVTSLDLLQWMAREAGFTEQSA